MTQSEFIADQIRRSHTGEAWHGPALTELLHGITAEQAAKQPVKSAHSIWQLVLHISAWQKYSLRRLHGEKFEADLDTPEDWPAIASANETAWQQALADLHSSNQQLCEAAKQCSDAKLQEPAPNRDHNYQFMLHGVVQHNLYHAGQIALLKKMV